jgi:hypothetical protein
VSHCEAAAISGGEVKGNRQTLSIVCCSIEARAKTVILASTGRFEVALICEAMQPPLPQTARIRAIAPSSRMAVEISEGPGPEAYLNLKFSESMQK